MAFADNLPINESLGVFVGVAGMDWLADGRAEPLNALLAAGAAGGVLLFGAGRGGLQTRFTLARNTSFRELPVSPPWRRGFFARQICRSLSNASLAERKTSPERVDHSSVRIRRSWIGPLTSAR